MTEMAPPGWKIETDRGPDWLFVRIKAEGQWAESGESEIAEALWNLLQQQFAHRLCLEMEHVPVLRSMMIGELVRLHKRIHASGGMLRLCGLSDEAQASLRASRLTDRFPQFPTREAAVMGRPNKPR